MKSYYKLSFLCFSIIFAIFTLITFSIASISIVERRPEEQKAILIIGIIILAIDIGFLILSLFMVRVVRFDELNNQLLYRNLIGNIKRVIPVSQIKKVSLISVDFDKIMTEIVILDEETEPLFNEHMLKAQTVKKVKLSNKIVVLEYNNLKFVEKFWFGPIVDETRNGLFKVYV